MRNKSTFSLSESIKRISLTLLKRHYFGSAFLFLPLILKINRSSHCKKNIQIVYSLFIICLYLCMSNKQKQEIMNYKNQLESLGFDVKKTFVRLGNRISNIQYSVSKNGKAYSFKTLKEAFELIDLF